jgi:hypothetical protein
MILRASFQAANPISEILGATIEYGRGLSRKDTARRGYCCVPFFSCLFSCDAIAEGKKPIDANSPHRDSRFRDKAPPIRCSKGAGHRDRSVMLDHRTESKKPRRIADQKKRQRMPMQVVDKPTLRCMSIHPTKEFHDFVIGQMVRE